MEANAQNQSAITAAAETSNGQATTPALVDAKKDKDSKKND